MVRQTKMSSQKRIQVPDGLRDVLLEFAIAYLLEQPGDVVDFAVEFFTKLQKDKRAQVAQPREPLSPDEESIISQDDGKCFSIFIFYLISFFFSFSFGS